MQTDEEPPDDKHLWQYADRARVSIRIADYPVEDQVHEWWEIEWGGTSFPRDWVVRAIESIPFDRQEYPLPYAVDVRDSRTSWGASGGVFEMVLYLGASGVIGGATWEYVKRLTTKMQTILTDSHAFRAQSRPLTEDETSERARLLVAERFDELPDDLNLEAIELVPPSGSEVVLRAPSGWRYTCAYAVQDGLITLCKVRKERTDM